MTRDENLLKALLKGYPNMKVTIYEIKIPSFFMTMDYTVEKYYEVYKEDCQK